MSRAATVVLMYHRVADDDKDPLAMRVRPARFAEQVDRLAHRFEIVPLADVRRRSSRPRVAITFDDGYADNAEVAAPILASVGAPATFFVTSRVLRDRSPFWWDVLEVLMVSRHRTECARIEVHVAEQHFGGDVHAPSARSRTLTELKRFCYRLSPERAFDAVLMVADQLGVDLGGSQPRFLRHSQLRELVADPRFEIGAHSVTHARLDHLTPEAAHLEMIESRAELSVAIGQPIMSFAYPHGGHDRAVVRMVARAGYSLACTVDPRGFRWLVSRYRVPRLTAEDIAGDRLVDRVADCMETASSTRMLARRVGERLARSSRAGQ